MLEVERQRMILKRVNERSVVSVSDLMDLLDVSEATIRRDIQSLAEAGQLRRVRGGVEALHPRHSTYLAGVPFNLASPNIFAIWRSMFSPTPSRSHHSSSPKGGRASRSLAAHSTLSRTSFSAPSRMMQCSISGHRSCSPELSASAAWA